MGKVATSPLPPGGPHSFRAGKQNQKWPTSGQGGYITPAVWGVPTASERGDRIRIGPQVGKVATSPLPPGGPHRFRAGGQNQKWPTSGQGGYITPAAWGSPPLPSGGTESEVAHKWARWLHHPCRLGGPHRFRAGGQNQKWPTSGQSGYITPAASGVPTASERGDRIRGGPQVGKVATSPLPPRGVPTASERGDKNPKWPTGGQGGYNTPAAWGSLPLRSGGTESEVAHKWARWLHHPCRLGGPHGFRAGGRIRSGPQVGKVATSPLPPQGVPTTSERGDRIRIGPQVGKMATLPLPLGGPHRFRAGGQNQKWPTSGQGGYITPAASGVPTASERGAESEVAHKWARWLHHPCRLGGPHRFRAAGRIRSGPQVGKVATSPLPPGGSPPLQSGETESELAHKWARWLHHPCRLGGPHRFRAGEQNQRWPTSGQGGYITPAASGGPHRFRAGGQNQNWPTSGQDGYITPAAWRSPPLLSGGTETGVAHKWARWPHYPCRLGVPTASERGDRIRSGPQVGKVATSPLPPRGSPRLQSGGQNQKWPTSGQGGYITPAASGVPGASERGAESEVAHKWARWLHHLCRLGGSPPLQSGGTESELAHKWARWLHYPCRLGVPTASELGDRIRSGPQVGKVATSPLPPRGSPRLQSGGQNQKWPTSGQGGYITPAASGVPGASERGAESEVAHKWAKWLHHPCRLGGPHRFRAGGQNPNWPTSGQGGYITPAASGVPTASERGDRIRGGPQVGKVATSPLSPRGSPPRQSGGAESELAFKWARWLHHPCRLGGPHRFRAGGRIKSGPQVDKVATSPLPPGGSPPIQSGGTESEVAHQWARWLHHPCRLGGPHRFKAGGQNQTWPTSGQGGYITPAAWGFPPLQSGGTESEVAHKWARWLHHPCRLGGPHRFRAGGQNPK